MSTSEMPSLAADGHGSEQGSPHVVQFYSDEGFLLEELGQFVGTTLAAGSSAVVIATKGHEDYLAQKLKARGLDLTSAIASGRYVPLNAAEMLSKFMEDGLPNEDRFCEMFGALIARAAASAEDENRRVVAFGEMVALLFAEGRPEAAIRVEKLWNQLARSHSFSLRCAYPMQGFCRQEHAGPLLRICAEHSSVIPDEKYEENYRNMASDRGRVRHFSPTSFSPTPREMQNVISSVESHLKEEQFRLFMEVVPDYAIYMLDPQGRVSTWNAGAERIKGYSASEIVGRNFSCFYLPEEILSGKSQKLLDLALQQGHAEDEGWRTRKDGTSFWASVTIAAVRDKSGQLLGFGNVTRDLSERRRAEIALCRSEDRFHLMAEAVHDYAIFMLDPEGYVNTWNTGAERIKGYKASEIIGRHFSCFYSDEEVRSGKPTRELEEAVKNGKFEEEGWRRRKDGSLFWANVVITPVRNEANKLIGFAKVTRDVTERMQKERALRDLTLHLLRMQDEERKRIGRDLHDTLGQCVTAMKISLDSLAASVQPKDPETGKQVLQCVHLAEECVREVRTISYLLYPPMLEEVGLRSAIYWYLEGFTSRSGIRATFDVSPDFGRLSRDAELALFRVLQEGLTNVHRHSGSETAHVRLSAQEGTATLEISDEGTGIPSAVLEEWGRSWQRAMGVGLRGMRERLTQLGGELEISSSDRGTTVRATVPAAELSQVSRPSA
jgi:PAS domain S-box-containing protein